MPLQDNLHKLYLLHLNVRGMEKRLKAAQRRHKAVGGKLDQLKQQQAELTEQHKHIQADEAALELDSKQAEERITHLRDQMSVVTSHKEYSALLVEVNTLKLAKDKVEEEALALLTRSDTVKAQLGELAQAIESQAKLVVGAEKEVAEQIAEVGDELDKLKAERDQAAALLPADVQTLFNRLAEAHEGEAMAEIVEADRKRREYTCGGCYLALPMERVNALFLKRTELSCCPNCSRILYIPSALAETLGVKA